MSVRSVSLGAVVAALLSAFGCQSSAVSARSGAPPAASPPGAHLPPRSPSSAYADRHPLGAADGIVRNGVSVFDAVPAVSKLDARLLRALRRAATEAGRHGVEFSVDSGWRSPAYQEELLRQAITKYGSREKAARWVATPETSAHVSGDAVDIGPADARTWLARHGAAYGLCRSYRNEPWHFELRPAAVDDGCPRMYADPSHDPRLQQ